MQRSLIAAALVFASFLASAGAAAANPRTGVTEFCGDRYCSSGAPAATYSRGQPSRSVRGDHSSKRESCPYSTVQTAAGPICINPEIASAMVGFISDVVDRGFKGRVNCYSTSRSHVARSLHKTAHACDFAQRGWNKTHRVMYRVTDLAARHSLRDGCTFRDCGHIDNGPAVTRGHHRRHHHQAPRGIAHR
jgi:hypothetical protein